MRRIMMVLSAALIMAAMLATTGQAFAAVKCDPEGSLNCTGGTGGQGGGSGGTQECDGTTCESRFGFGSGGDGSGGGGGTNITQGGTTFEANGGGGRGGGGSGFGFGNNCTGIFNDEGLLVETVCAHD